MGYISTAFLLLLALLSHKHLQQFEQHTFPSAVTKKYQGKGRFIYLFFSIIFYLLLEHNAIDFNQNHFGIFFSVVASALFGKLGWILLCASTAPGNILHFQWKVILAIENSLRRTFPKENKC